jgi:ribosome biogenesis GTPase
VRRRETEAVVVRVAGPTVTVLQDGCEREVRLTPRVPGGPAVAGDRVRVRHDSDEEAIIVAVEPRTTVLERGDGPEGRPRTIVANADLVVIVAAVVDPPLRPRLIDRYLVAATIGGLEAAIVITKTDLAHDADELGEVLAPYRALGHPALSGVAKDPAFIETVRALIGGRVAILAGHSGVGKSTLTSALTGVPRAVGAVSEKVRTGRHTTSDPRLIPLPGRGRGGGHRRRPHLPPAEDGPRDARVGLPGHRPRGCRMPLPRLRAQRRRGLCGGRRGVRAEARELPADARGHALIRGASAP